MNGIIRKLYIKFLELKESEEGQDLIEYALLVAMIALAAVTSARGVATAISKVFNNISSTLGS